MKACVQPVDLWIEGILSNGNPLLTPHGIKKTSGIISGLK
jgi:hypothetical protein